MNKVMKPKWVSPDEYKRDLGFDTDTYDEKVEEACKMLFGPEEDETDTYVGLIADSKTRTYPQLVATYKQPASIAEFKALLNHADKLRQKIVKDSLDYYRASEADYE